MTLNTESASRARVFQDAESQGDDDEWNLPHCHAEDFDLPPCSATFGGWSGPSVTVSDECEGLRAESLVCESCAEMLVGAIGRAPEAFARLEAA